MAAGAAWELWSAPNYPLDIQISNDQGKQVGLLCQNT